MFLYTKYDVQQADSKAEILILSHCSSFLNQGSQLQMLQNLKYAKISSSFYHFYILYSSGAKIQRENFNSKQMFNTLHLGGG